MRSRGFLGEATEYAQVEIVFAAFCCGAVRHTQERSRVFVLVFQGDIVQHCYAKLAQ